MRYGFAAAASAAVVLAAAGNTLAQDEGFALNRFEPSERGSDWFASESLDFRGEVRPALGLVFDWSHRPLVLYEPDGDDELAAIVANQVYGHVGGAVVLYDRVRVGANLPVLLYQNGESAEYGAATLSTNEGTSVGDLRLGVDLRIVGEYTGPFNLAVGAQLFAPTGSQDAFASDGKVRIRPRLMAAGDVGAFAYAAQIGFNYRALDADLGGAPVGSEFVFAAAAGVRAVDDKLLIGPEVWGSTVVSESGAAFDRQTTPVELAFTGKYRVSDDVRIGAGVGPGMTRGFGAPKVRLLASIEWFPAIEEEAPPPPPADRDEDGILDDDDACPDEPGIVTDDPATSGCPPPEDRDGDGIVDDEDACPDEPGKADEDPAEHGCPPPSDRDGDGIPDAEDACPDEAGEANEDPAMHGCAPPQDSDGDGILDPDDACPEIAGVESDDPKKHGCPKVKVTKTKIEILERIEFDTGKATIRPESESILRAVQEILEKYDDIKKIEVQGHTDNRGARYYNVALSQRRAASVVDWLVAQGIARDRLVSKGFGPDQPIDDNDTEEGRQNNRRVEFHILERTSETPNE